MCIMLDMLEESGVKKGRREGQREGRLEEMTHSLRVLTETCQEFEFKPPQTVSASNHREKSSGLSASLPQTEV